MHVCLSVCLYACMYVRMPRSQELTAELRPVKYELVAWLRIDDSDGTEEEALNALFASPPFLPRETES